MKQKTKLKIIQKIAQKLTLEDKFSRYQSLAVWAAYFLQIGIFQICLLVAIAEPQLHLSQKLSAYTSLQITLFSVRMTFGGIYLLFKSSYIIPVIKILQIANVYLLRTQFCAIPLIVEFLAQMYLILRKEKRHINFDSRLENKYFGTKIFAIYILLLATFLTPNSQINKNPSAVFFTAIIYYVSACLDNIYSYRTKQILRNIALCPILMAIYFICEPLVPAVNNFGLAAHTFVSLCILLVIMLYAVTSEYPYHHDILYKKILNLESRDKLLYLWSLIYFSEAPTHNSLLCFIKTHQSKCFNSLCPLNFNQNRQNGNQSSTNFSQEAIQKSIKIYLKKALQRFASQSDQIRRLFIYFRKEDDPKIVHLLRQDDVYQKIQEFRISKNLQRYNDPSLEYQQMKQIQDQTLTKVKLFLNHYDYFLSYINKEAIKMQTSQQIIKQLLKLKTYFLSFKPNTILQNEQEKKSQNSSKKSKKNSKGYQQLDTQTIPVKKMTLKTIMLVNFMRRVYFNLPSLQKQQFSTKKMTYITEDFEQSPILVISAESYNLGKIINWNSMAQKALLYSTKQLRSKFVNDLLPKPLHKIHEKIFMKASLQIELYEVNKSLEAFVFCFTKASYAEVFELKIQGANSISGNKWVVEMKPQFQGQPIVIVDEYRNVVGLNKNCVNFGISLNVMGELMNQELYNRLVEHRRDKISLGRDVEPIDGVKLDNQTQWQLVCTTPTYEDMPKYSMFLIQHSYEIQKLTLSRFSKNKQQNTLEPQLMPTNNFEFNFDPFDLKYSNLPIKSHSSADLQLIWQQNQDFEQQYPQYHEYKKGSQPRIKNYSQNIHEMIYFDNKLEFKENYEVVTEFQTHPNYVAGGKMSGMRTIAKMNISKENFVDNISKIQEKTPSYVYKLAVLFVVIIVMILITLSLRLITFNTLYEAAKEKEFVKMQMLNRKNLIDNIGSLGVYFNKSKTYPNIWDRYLTNKWTFQELFVQIEYTNGKINNINSDIGLLVNRVYKFNNKTKTLASYFESLSIQASTQSTGQLNLTQFILEIVDDIEALQSLIQADVEGYYQKLFKDERRNIYIIDSCLLAACLVLALVMHIILRGAYSERVHLFRSLSVIQQEEIYRIQKNLNDHREQIRNNELDTIQEDDYTEPLQSQNIPHTKKMFNSFFRSKVIFFYVFGFIFLAIAGIFFYISEIYYHKIEKIELVTPFINIVGQQRNSMAKMYLNVIANTKNSTVISADIMKNIRMFEVNKKGVIDSLIAKEFSNDYLTFYNQIWFSPCEVMGVQDQCSSLFAGILSDNLDYNYVYILTQVQKIVDYRIQRATSPLAADPQFIKDIDTEIQTSYKKINFLLFDFMIRLESSFGSKIQSQVYFLYEKIYQSNLWAFLAAIGGSILSAIILFYLIYLVKDLPNETLEMVTTVVPYCILMRNEYFVDWYRKKFKNVY